MKRIHALGLCLAAAFALSALAMSTSAFAGEYGQCRELTKTTTPKAKHGKYEEGNCVKLAVKVKNGKEEPDDKGNFEWFPGPSPSCVYEKKKGAFTEEGCKTYYEKTKKGVKVKEKKGNYEFASCASEAAPNGCAEQASSTGPATLATEQGTVKCKASTDSGTITGVKSDTDTVSFTGCELLGSECTSLNTTSKGEIKTFLLETTLIEHGEKGLSGLEPKEGEAWVQFANVAGKESPWNAKFGCSGIGYFEVDGSVSGPITPLNVSTEEFHVKVEKGLGEQDLKASICTSPEYTTCPFPNLAATQSAENAVTKDAAGEKNEVKT